MARRSSTLLVVERDSGPVYYAKWRLEDGTQVKRRLGPAWLVRIGGDRGRPGVAVRRTGS